MIVEGIPFIFNGTRLSDDYLIGLKMKINSYDNLNAMNADLKVHGPQLVKEKKEREIYVISEKGFGVGN